MHGPSAIDPAVTTIAADGIAGAGTEEPARLRLARGLGERRDGDRRTADGVLGDEREDVSARRQLRRVVFDLTLARAAAARLRRQRLVQQAAFPTAGLPHRVPALAATLAPVLALDRQLNGRVRESWYASISLRAACATCGAWQSAR